jgi:hypothetical protein
MTGATAGARTLAPDPRDGVDYACGLAGLDPACSPLAIAVVPGRLMSERIDARGDITIAGASGDAVRGEPGALTRWGPAGLAVLSSAAAVAHRAWGCAEESAAGGGDRREPHRRLGPGQPGSAAMTAADRTRECYTRCVPRLARLRLLAGDGGPLPPGAAGEVGHAARAIVAETGAAGQAAVAVVAESRRGSAAVFLAARQARLAAAAEDLAAAAAGPSAAALSRPLRRFEALATALWTVQSDLRPASPPGGAAGGIGSPMRTPDCGPAASGS